MQDAKELKLKANHNIYNWSPNSREDAKELKLKANHNKMLSTAKKVTMQKN